MVVTNGMANSSIDLAAAEEFGVMISGTPSGLFSTTEITWALILAVAKGLPRADADVRAGVWQQELPTDLAGKTLGLLGLGRLGAAMIPIAQAFSMQVIAWSQNLTAARTDELGVQLVTKAELMSESDFLSIQLRLSERTTGLIGKEELALMRPTAAIINTARGPIIDETALIEALRTNTIRGAGLDVYDVEPMPKDHPFNTLKNVVMTPHLGYASESNLLHYMSDAFVNIASYLAGEPLHLLGPDTVH
jgi:phosphoglycerate dehydrogenase-like enzyme